MKRPTKVVTNENEPMKRILLHISLVILFSVHLGKAVPIKAQENVLRGPILVTQLDKQITFQDVGAERVWQTETSAQLYTSNIWTPDGCKIIVAERSESSTHYFLLSITDFEIEALSPLGRPLWSPDGESIVFLNSSVKDSNVNVYLTDSTGLNPELIATIPSNEWVGDVQWLSGDSLLYILRDGNRFIWNRTTRTISLLEADQFKRPSYGRFYTSKISPNREIWAVFADLADYRGALDPSINDLTDSEIAAIEVDEPKMTGFDLFFLKTGTVQHLDVNGQFLTFLEWSPASHRIAVTTDYKGNDFGIFVYNLETDKLQRIADAYIEQGFSYIPTWSWDEEWVAFRTSTGYFIQHLSDVKRIQLDERMNGSQLFWSPVMDYSKSRCD